MGRKPIIGITGYHLCGEEGHGGKIRGTSGQGFSLVGHDYIYAVERSGGVSLGVPVLETNQVESIVNALDGLVITGGEDVNPRLYGVHVDLRVGRISPERDEFELALLEEALKQNKPILCICRGLQLLNVYFGGTLYKDIADYSDTVLSHQFESIPRWYLAHKVKLQASVLQNIYQSAEIETNSFHHQAVRDVGSGLQVAAVAEDGIVEGLYHPGHPKLLGIQWHPEMMAPVMEEGLIPFQWLVRQCEK